MKKERQQAIKELIEQKNIDTQQGLKAELEKLGFKVTQATVSRDINDMGLVKVLRGQGQYRYSVMPQSKRRLSPIEELYSLMKTLTVSLDYAGNTVVIKCQTGMAQAVCAKLDAAALPQVVGTLAGDDTIFVLVRTHEDAARLADVLSSAADGLTD